MIMVLKKAGKCELIVVEECFFQGILIKDRDGEQRKRLAFEFLGGDFSNFSEK